MPHHILILEDDLALRELYSLFLERGNFDHTAVSCVEDALSALSAHWFDAVLVDVNLNENLSGMNLVEMVRDVERYDHMKIVLLTSFPDRFDALQSTYIDHYLNKPINYDSLISALNQILTITHPE